MFFPSPGLESESQPQMPPGPVRQHKCANLEVNVLSVKTGCAFSAAHCSWDSVQLIGAMWESGFSVAKVPFPKLNLLFLRPNGENLEGKIQSNISSKNNHLKDNEMVKYYEVINNMW